MNIPDNLPRLRNLEINPTYLSTKKIKRTFTSSLHQSILKWSLQHDVLNAPWKDTYAGYKLLHQPTILEYVKLSLRFAKNLRGPPVADRAALRVGCSTS